MDHSNSRTFRKYYMAGNRIDIQSIMLKTKSNTQVMKSIQRKALVRDSRAPLKGDPKELACFLEKDKKYQKLV